MEDFDIYADLPSFNPNENENQENNNKKFEEKNQILEKEVSLLKTKVEELEGLNNKLKNNFSSLIKTAKAEISRKDRTISDLRAQLDNITFRRNQYHRNKMHLKNNHYLNYPPPPINTEFQNEVTQYQEINNYINSEPELVIEESVQEENIETETQKHVNDNEYDDAITNKSEYRNTVYGDRLRKKLLEERENERRKKEEESKQKNESFDKVNNKENLALINEAAQKIDSNINSDKTLDTVNNSTDFVKTEITLTKRIDYVESKEDHFVNRKNDIQNTNKYFVTNGSITDSISRNYSNNYNDSSLHKDHRNRDYYNHQNRHKLNEMFYSESNNRDSRRDKHINTFEKYDRHRNLYRYKSRDRERSSSSSGTKDDLRKKYCKSLDDKHDRISRKIKPHRKDKEDKYNFSPNPIKLHKRDKEDRKKLQSSEKSKKYKEDKIKTPKRKRRSESEEKISHKIKQRKTSNDISNEAKISVEEVNNESLESKESIQEKERKKLNFDTDKSKNYIEYVKETVKQNKTMVEKITTKRKESSQEKDRKKITIQEYNEKLANNEEYIKDLAKSNKSTVKQIQTYNFEHAKTMQKVETNRNNNREKIISSTSYITDIKQVNQKPKNNVETLLEELEEGEIVDSPNDELQNDYTENQKVQNTVKTKINVETIVSKEFKIQKNNKVKETLSSSKVESNYLSETEDKNYKSLEIITNTDEQCIKNIKPKNEENKNTENRLLFTLLTQGISGKLNDSGSVHKEIQEKTIEKSKLDIKSVKCENNFKKSNKVSTINTKVIKQYNDKINNKISVSQTKPMKKEDNGNDGKLQITDNDEISKEKSTIPLEENNIKNIPNIEEHKDNKKLQIKKDEVKDFSIEIKQNITDMTLQKHKKQEPNINKNLEKQIFKPLGGVEIPSTNKEIENSLNKKTQNVSKIQTVKNVIVIRRRRRPVQLSDSPPVLIITQTDLCKST